MNKTKCVIIEDTLSDLQLLQYYINKTSSLHLLQTFNNPLEADVFLRTHQPSVIFMDIDMPVMSGLELYKKLQYSPICIFVTAHSEYALQSYEVHAFDFIVKPVTEKRFAKTIQRLHEYIAIKEMALLYQTTFEHQNIIIKEGQVNHKVNIDDILYIEALKDYCKIITQDKSYITLSSLKEFIDKLPPDNFIRIHRSYAVAKGKVEKLYKDEVLIKGHNIPIGKTYRSESHHFFGL